MNQFIKVRSKYLLGILLLALVVRFVGLNQSLWLDEAIGAIAVTKYSYSEIVTDFMRADNHPPLYYLLLKAWSGVFGTSEIGLRSLSVVLGVATIYLTYKIAELISVRNNRLFPILSSLLITLSQFHIYYSQEARMYVMAGFFASIAIYGFLLVEKRHNKGWLLFSMSLPLMLMSDFVPVFMLPVFLIFGTFKRKSANWWKLYFLAHIPLVLVGLLYLPLFLLQVENGRWLTANWPQWQTVAGGATLKQAILVWNKFALGRVSLFNKPLYYSLIGLISIPLVFSIYNAFRFRKKIQILILWLIVPLITGFVASIWFPAFNYFRFMYIVPTFYLVIGWGIYNLPKKIAVLFSVWILFFSIGSIYLYNSDIKQQREQWRQAVDFIETNAKDNEIAIFEFPEPFAPYLWYEKGQVPSLGVTNSINADTFETRELTLQAIEGVDGIYYFEYLNELSDPGNTVVTTLKSEGLIVEDVINFEGVGRVYYYR